MNAMKHGIFSSAVLLRGESHSEFQSLVIALREYFRAEGFLEELLVEKLAILVWRYRRMLRAECVAIENPHPAVSTDTRLRQICEVRALEKSNPATGGLLGLRSNPYAMKRAVQSLTELRSNIVSRGLDVKEDSLLLLKVYGYNPLESPPHGFFKIHALLARAGANWDSTAGVSLTAEEVKEHAVEVLNAEIQHLGNLRQTITELEADRIDHHKEVALTLPPETFLRYEAHLDRLFDRTLNQLERLQRIRRGQPVPPRIDVTVSS